MKITLYTRLDGCFFDLFCKCPFCEKICGENSLTDDDYIEYPMLWCVECNARAVFDPKSYFNAKKELKKLQSTYCLEVPPSGTSSVNSTGLRVEKTPRIDYDHGVEVPLLLIERLSDHLMGDYISDRVLSFEEVKELADSYDYDKHFNDYDPEIVKKLNLKKSDEDVYPTDRRENVMNISVIVDSYNAFVPKKEFGCKVSTAHDGVYVGLQVKELDGTSSVIFFWGD